MPKSYIPRSIKKSVKERAKGYCEYCLLPSNHSPAPFVIDHILPESLNGETILENLAYCCGGCNGHKHDKIKSIDPDSKLEVKLYNPRQDKWSEHFAWDDDEIKILGKSSKGRATIDLLQTNREQNQNLRSLLRLVGFHPPKDYP